jgi:hypothetical protein
MVNLAISSIASVSMTRTTVRDARMLGRDPASRADGLRRSSARCQSKGRGWI